MDEMFFRMMMSGGFGGGGGYDLSAVIAFLGIAVIYLIIPKLGLYCARPGGMVVALYALIGYGSISLLQLLVQWALILEGSVPGVLLGREGGFHVMLLFAALKMLAFLVALLAFVSSLRSVRMGSRSGEG